MNLIKSTSTFSLFVLLSRVLGYIRDFFIAIYLGSGPLADAFFVAFRIPNTFRRLFAVDGISPPHKIAKFGSAGTDVRNNNKDGTW